MPQFATRTLEDVVETLIDYRGKTPVRCTSGIKLVTAKVIKDGRILDGPHEFISEDSYDSWMRRGLPQQWDVLITTEAPLGEVAMLRTPEKVALAQRVILLRGRAADIDQQYLFQAMKSPFVQGELLARGTGTTVLGIKQSELRRIRIPVYALTTQRRIAVVLSAYDDLIENNTRRIQILEQMAQAIYREWFVNFRFPGHEKSRLVNSSERKIPAGWTSSVLGDLVKDVRDGVDPSAVDGDTPYFGLEHLPRKSIALAEWGRASEVQGTKLAFRCGDILFGKIRPYFHKVDVAPVDGVCSSDTIVMRAKDPRHFSLALACVSSELFVAHATQTSQGTKMPRANWDVLVKYPVPTPPPQLLSLFNDQVALVVPMLKNLVLRNRNLRRTRDLLLPKLISGEVDVSEMEIAGEGPR